MTKEEYYNISNTLLSISRTVVELTERCFVAENAKLKVGDFTVNPDSTEILKVTDRHSLMCMGKDEKPDVDVLYTLESIDDGKEYTFTQKELFKDE